MLDRVSRAIKRRFQKEREFGDDDEERLTLKNLKDRAQKNFPLCAQHLHDGLQREHHLKHESRNQYVLFLKGGGLRLRETVQHWCDSSFDNSTTLNPEFQRCYSNYTCNSIRS